MKQRLGLFIGMLLTIMMLFTVSVSAEGFMYHVFDEYGILNSDKDAELEERLQRIYDTYGFDVVLWISPDISGDERQIAAAFMQEYGRGYGEDNDGMCIFHQPDNRMITIVFRGKYQDDFTVEVQDLMLDHCTEAFLENNIVNGYEVLITDLESGLKRVAEGKSIRPMDIDNTGIIAYAVEWLGISFLFMIIPVGILMLVQMSKMKTKTPQKNADFYSPRESFDLQVCRDIYLRTDVKKRKIEKDNSGSGSSGSFSSGGESFSGSSRKY